MSPAVFALLGAVVTQTASFDYLHRASLTPSIDTIDTFTSEAGGSPQRESGTYIIRGIRQVAGERWEVVDTWYDSTGKREAEQYMRTASRALMTELEVVRADIDSASMLVTRDHLTAWVVHAGQPPQLFDGNASGERYTLANVIAAAARAKSPVGTTFRYPAYSLHVGSPLTIWIDSLRVAGRDTLRHGALRLPVVVLQRSNGGQLWVDETTGAEVASRGNAGPGRWWWHVRRGVTPPATPAH